MENKLYYSERNGSFFQPIKVKVDIEKIRDLFNDIYRYFNTRGYFQEDFGIDCVDGWIPGHLAMSMGDTILYDLGREYLILPLHKNILSYSENDIFDVIEFLHEHCSKPLGSYYHNYFNCGHHYNEFDRLNGQAEYRNKINNILVRYKDGYELSDKGEILVLAENGLDSLFTKALPIIDPANIEDRVEAAINKFRRHNSTLDEKRDAIRSLVDVLEHLRPKAKMVLLRKDESELFEIANRFGIRHHREDQITNYDKPIWYSWMFHYYLTTIHALTRLIKKAEIGN